MTEPSASTAVSIAAPALSVGATAIDITLWPFAITFFFAVVTLMAYENEEMSHKKAFANVLSSTGIGGALSQYSAVPILLWVESVAPSLQPWTVTAKIPMTILIAMLVGLTAHKAMPKLLNLIGGFRSSAS